MKIDQDIKSSEMNRPRPATLWPPPPRWPAHGPPHEAALPGQPSPFRGIRGCRRRPDPTAAQVRASPRPARSSVFLMLEPETIVVAVCAGLASAQGTKQTCPRRFSSGTPWGGGLPCLDGVAWPRSGTSFDAAALANARFRYRRQKRTDVYRSTPRRRRKCRWSGMDVVRACSRCSGCMRNEWPLFAPPSFPTARDCLEAFVRPC